MATSAQTELLEILFYSFMKKKKLKPVFKTMNREVLCISEKTEGVQTFEKIHETLLHERRDI